MQHLAVDTETTGRRFFHGVRPFAIFTCDEDGNTKHWEFDVDPHTRQPIVSHRDRIEVKNYLSSKTLVFHNIRFDVRALQSIGILLSFGASYSVDNAFNVDKPVRVLCPDYEDTLLASHVCDSGSTHKLKNLGALYLDIPDDDEKELRKHVASCRRIAKQRGWKISESIEGVAEDYWLPRALNKRDKHLSNYGTCDAIRTMQLWQMYNEILDDEGVRDSYKREKALVPIIFQMESEGIRVNVVGLFQQLKDRLQRSHQYEKTILRLAGNAELNIRSGKQLRSLLYEKLKLPTIRVTGKSREPSTNKTTLTDLYEQYLKPHTKGYRIVESLLAYRSLKTSCGYLTGYRGLLCPSTGCQVLYPNFNQTGTRTTRLSSSDPNGQNVDEELRQVFGARPNCTWYAIDYDQLELRIFATASNESKMLAALKANEDVHQITADYFGVARKRGKAINFAWQYGAGQAKLSEMIRLAGGKGDAKLLSKLYPDVTKFIRSTIDYGTKHGWVFTLDGYRLSVPSQAPYVGVDYVCQGTAGDIVKNAMIEVYKYLEGVALTYTSRYQDYKGALRVVLNVHDELIIEIENWISKADREEIIETIAMTMSAAGQHLKRQSVFTPVEVSLCKGNWGTKEKLFQIAVGAM